MKTLFKNYKFAIVLLLIAPLMACSSDDDGSPEPEPTVAELLANQWFIIQTEDTSTNPSTIAVANDCQKNGYFNFLSDGRLNRELFNLDMNDDCDSSGIIEFTYVLNPDNEQVVITSAMDNSEILIIESISSTSFTAILGSIKIIFER